MELSEQAAIGQVAELEAKVAELEAKVAELEAQGRRLEAERVKAEKALRTEKRCEESGQCMPNPLLCYFASDLLFV